MVIEQEHPLLGKVRLPNLPFRFSECDATQTVPAPLLGQHTREVLREQVAALAVKGAEQILRKEVNASVHADLLGRLKSEL